MTLTPRMRWTTPWSMTGEIKSSFRCSELRGIGTAQGEENSVRVEGSIGCLGGKLLLAEAPFLHRVGGACVGVGAGVMMMLIRTMINMMRYWLTFIKHPVMH